MLSLVDNKCSDCWLLIAQLQWKRYISSASALHTHKCTLHLPWNTHYLSADVNRAPQKPVSDLARKRRDSSRNVISFSKKQLELPTHIFFKLLWCIIGIQYTVHLRAYNWINFDTCNHSWHQHPQSKEWRDPALANISLCPRNPVPVTTPHNHWSAFCHCSLPFLEFYTNKSHTMYPFMPGFIRSNWRLWDSPLVGCVGTSSLHFADSEHAIFGTDISRFGYPFTC